MTVVAEQVAAAPLVGGAETGLHSHAGSSYALTTIEVSLGAAPAAKRAGRFTISASGLVTGKPVAVHQVNGPYTGKGTRADEAEMDKVVVSANVLSATSIECFWASQRRVRGNYKFAYIVSG